MNRYNNIDGSSSSSGITEDEVAILYGRRRRTLTNMLVKSGFDCLQQYHMSYVDKVPCRTSALTGYDWVIELLTGHDGRCHENLRMESDVFLKLCGELVNKYELQVPKKGLTVEESVAIFLCTIGKGLSNRELQERFQHSGETINRHFHYVLKAVKNMAAYICQPINDQNYVHPYIGNNRKYHPFKDCIGALDGTHVHARLPQEDAIPYFGRKGCHTQNILAVCDFDMCFTFVSAGWEGSMHDMRVFYNIVMDPNKHFPHPQGDKYYLVDAGYPNKKGYLAPYKGERYHFQEFHNGEPPNTENEAFNQVHSSLRSVIERTFGVWKARWAILRDMPAFDMKVQTAIVGGSMAIHNFMRRNTERDEVFDRIANIEHFVLEDDISDANINEEQSSNLMSDDEVQMNASRDRIRQRISRRANRYNR